MHVEFINNNSYSSVNVIWLLTSTFQATKEKQSDLLAIARCNNLHWRTDGVKWLNTIWQRLPLEMGEVGLKMCEASLKMCSVGWPHEVGVILVCSSEKWKRLSRKLSHPGKMQNPI